MNNKEILKKAKEFANKKKQAMQGKKTIKKESFDFFGTLTSQIKESKKQPAFVSFDNEELAKELEEQGLKKTVLPNGNIHFEKS